MYALVAPRSRRPEGFVDMHVGMEMYYIGGPILPNF